MSEFLTKSIVRRFNAVILSLITSSFLIFSIIFGYYNYNSNIQALNLKATNLGELAGTGLQDPIWNSDVEAAASFVDAILLDSDVVALQIFESLDPEEPIFEKKREENSVLGALSFGDLQQHPDILLIEQEVSKDEEVLGKVIVMFSKKSVLEEARNTTILIAVFTTLLLVLIGFMIAGSSQKILKKPIIDLGEHADELAQGNLEVDIDTSRKDELGSLASSFAEMRDAIRNKIKDLGKLNQTGEVLAKTFEQTKALETVLTVLKEKTGIEKGSVYLLDEDNTLQVKAFYPIDMPPLNDNPRKFKFGEGITGRAAQEKKIIHIPDTSQEADFVDKGTNRARSLLCVPLMDGDKLYGVFNFSGPVGSITFDKSDREFTRTLANMTVITAKNIKMVNVIEEHSRTLEDKVQERTSAIKDLLDNTGQGFFSFGRDYRINPEYSRACEAFFGKSITGENGLELMFGTPEDHEKGTVAENVPHPDSAKELLEMVFEGTGDMSVFGDMLPSETKIGDMILDISFNFIENEQEKKFMVILTDVTVERELALQIARDEERNETIVKIATDMDGFKQFLREVNGLFSSVNNLLAKPCEQIDVNELFRYYHTIKGGTASYGLRKVAEQTHQIEAELEEVRTGHLTLSNDLTTVMKTDTVKLRKALDDVLTSLGNLISKEDQEQTESIYKVKSSKIAKIQEQLLSSLPEDMQDHINQVIAQLRKQPIGPMIQKYAAAAEGLGEKLNKPIEIQSSGKSLEVSYDRLENVFGSLVHLVRNCVDHGLEEPETRIMLGKPEQGKIKIEALKGESGSLKLVISDDGGGIDAEVIKNVALKKGLIDESVASTMVEEEAVKLILAPGFSTKEEVTDVSGRGVGMDAVKFSVEELGGNIHIDTELDVGTTFTITIPDSESEEQKEALAA